jgi:hypothetical protein
MAIGFGVEIILVNHVVFTIKNHNSPAFWLWMLIIVGALFLIFMFSHGPLAGLLGLVCVINVAIGLRFEEINYCVFWVIDLFLKIFLGCGCCF